MPSGLNLFLGILDIHLTEFIRSIQPTARNQVVREICEPVKQLLVRKMLQHLPHMLVFDLL
jgi:hypothetical protein